MTDIQMMILIVQAYLDKLELIHPPVRSLKFRDNCYEKVACKEILRELIDSKDLPFSLTALDILEQYSEKMKSYACEHIDKEHSFVFLKQADTAEYFIEQYWINFNQWRK